MVTMFCKSGGKTQTEMIRQNEPKAFPMHEEPVPFII